MNDKKKPKARVEYKDGTFGAKATINLADSVDWKQFEPSPGSTLIIEGGQTKVDLTAPSSLNPNLYQGIGSLIPQTTLSTTLAGSLEVKKAYPQEKIDFIRKQFDALVGFYGGNSKDPDSVKDAVYREIANDIANHQTAKEKTLNWRTLKGFYVTKKNKNSKELTWDSYDALFLAMNFCYLVALNSPNELLESIEINASDKIFLEPYMPPSSERGLYRDSLKAARDNFEILWSGFWTNMKGKDEIDYLTDFQNEVLDFFEECSKNKIGIYYGKLPRTNQPPEEFGAEEPLDVSYFLLYPQYEILNAATSIFRRIDWNRELKTRNIF